MRTILPSFGQHLEGGVLSGRSDQELHIFRKAPRSMDFNCIAMNSHTAAQALGLKKWALHLQVSCQTRAQYKRHASSTAWAGRMPRKLAPLLAAEDHRSHRGED
jgi:hypothetical protein